MEGKASHRRGSLETKDWSNRSWTEGKVRGALGKVQSSQGSSKTGHQSQGLLLSWNTRRIVWWVSDSIIAAEIQPSPGGFDTNLPHPLTEKLDSNYCAYPTQGPHGEVEPESPQKVASPRSLAFEITVPLRSWWEPGTNPLPWETSPSPGMPWVTQLPTSLPP
jgi:hypothetical protein